MNPSGKANKDSMYQPVKIPTGRVQLSENVSSDAAKQEARSLSPTK
jgi:hypothetical protein